VDAVNVGRAPDGVVELPVGVEVPGEAQDVSVGVTRAGGVEHHRAARRHGVRATGARDRRRVQLRDDDSSAVGRGEPAVADAHSHRHGADTGPCGVRRASAGGVVERPVRVEVPRVGEGVAVRVGRGGGVERHAARRVDRVRTAGVRDRSGVRPDEPESDDDRVVVARAVRVRRVQLAG
jgi:hypothetical protein